MISAVLSFLIFGSFIILQILLFRIFSGFKIFKILVTLFPLGGIFINFYTLQRSESQFVWSLTFLYLLLTLNYLVYYLSAMGGEESPSGKIYRAVGLRKKLTQKEILALFSEEELVDKRLESLVSAGLISKGKNYVVTSSGNMIAFLIGIYRQLLGWKVGG